MAYERWYYIEDDKLWKHVENVEHAFLRRQFIQDTPLCSVEEAKVRYPSELKAAEHISKE
jgi:hypothetical protein